MKGARGRSQGRPVLVECTLPAPAASPDPPFTPCVPARPANTQHVMVGVTYLQVAIICCIPQPPYLLPAAGRMHRRPRAFLFTSLEGRLLVNGHGPFGTAQRFVCSKKSKEASRFLPGNARAQVSLVHSRLLLTGSKAISPSVKRTARRHGDAVCRGQLGKPPWLAPIAHDQTAV